MRGEQIMQFESFSAFLDMSLSWVWFLYAENK